MVEEKREVKALKDMSVNEKLDIALGLQAHEEKKAIDKIGYQTASVVGGIAGIAGFVVGLFLWTFFYALGAGAIVFLLVTVFAAKMKWQPWIPWNAKVGKRKIRNGWVLVYKYNLNKGWTFMRSEIKDGTILVDGIPRIVTANNIGLYKGKKPMVVCLGYSIQLLDLVDHYEKTTAAGLGTKGWKLLISRIKTEALVEKKGISGTVIWIIIIAIGALGYFAYRGGWF
jgi:hypothetical protein